MEVSRQLQARPAVEDPAVSIRLRQVGAPQGRSEHFAGKRNHLPLPGIETRFLSRPARCLVTILTELSQPLPYINKETWAFTIQQKEKTSVDELIACFPLIRHGPHRKRKKLKGVNRHIDKHIDAQTR
jgi:hypothetical protein